MAKKWEAHAFLDLISQPDIDTAGYCQEFYLN
jgi:hypothetical protein